MSRTTQAQGFSDDDLKLHEAEETMPLLQARIETLLEAYVASSPSLAERLTMAEELSVLFARADRTMQQVHDVLMATAAQTGVDATVIRLVGEIDEVRATFTRYKERFESTRAIFGDDTPQA
ncbi:hypothetical protein [Chondromyces crocatus]|uniref:Uncharacterized protein n=1 Tax=Chondromyces crocatus TaxID=52 RepID=A0A0K1EH04_CHOCO|nr:hypothetical protein [Chondromyces crocatus]AKT40141.1 uncharacterized protein CMC5_042940 [Chondromyces crocatus]